MAERSFTYVRFDDEFAEVNPTRGLMAPAEPLDYSRGRIPGTALRKRGTLGVLR